MRPFIAAVTFAGLAIALPCCRYVDVLIGDCDDATHYSSIVARINADSDIAPVFAATREPPLTPTPSVLQAKIYFARKAVACRCNFRPHYNAQLGALLLEQGQLIEAKDAFEASIAAEPTREAWSGLALVYDCLGDKPAAAAARQKAEGLRGQWDPPLTPGA